MFLVAVFVCLFVFFVLFRKCQNCLLGLLMCLVSWRIMFHHAKACYIYRAVGDPGKRPGGPAPPLFLDQIVARRVEKLFLRPPPPPPSLSEGLDPPLRWYWEPSVCTTAEFQPKLGNSFMSKCCHKVLQMRRCQSVKKETLNRFCLYYNTCTESSREAKINKSVKGC